jgi:hypothetical protein
MPIPIVLYTHSEYSFLWRATIPLLERYAKEFEIIWCCDTLLDYTLPPKFRLYTYNTSDSWGYRVKGCIETIQSKYVIYLQEDWLLIDAMDPLVVDHCIEFMEKFHCEFLMSYPNNMRKGSITSKYENYIFVKIFSHYFQPAIWKWSLLHEICCLNTTLGANEDEKCFTISKDRNCYAVDNMRFQKDMTTRSLFFPHIHAMYKGKWTFFKYPCLKALVEAYGIDTSTRKVDTEWMPDFQ